MESRAPLSTSTDHKDIYDVKKAFQRADKELPPPEDTPIDYTKEALEKRQEYVARLREREITPRAKLFILLYSYTIDSALKALDEDGNEHKENATAQCELVKAYDDWLNGNPTVASIPSAEMRQLVKDSVTLKLWEFYARYADCCGEWLRAIKEKMKTLGLPEQATFKDLWSQTWRDIVEERKQVSLMGGEEATPADQMQTILSMRRVASALGISRDHFFRAIEIYAKRNDSFHNDITELLKDGEWQELARQLYFDDRDLEAMRASVEDETWDRHNQRSYREFEEGVFRSYSRR